jgi:hypothetical protein
MNLVYDFEVETNNLLYVKVSHVQEYPRSRHYDVFYRVKLAQLDPSERDLNAGRFINFKKQWFDNCQGMVVKGDVMGIFEPRLNWVGENVQNTWSFSLKMKNAHEGHLSWSFQDISDALLFKLTF